MILENPIRITPILKLYHAGLVPKGSVKKQKKRASAKNAYPCFVYRDGMIREFASVIESMRVVGFRLSKAQSKQLRETGWTCQARSDLVIWYKGREKPSIVKMST